MKITKRFVFFFTENDIYSQWYPCIFFENGKQFNNAEQYMMYHKALLFNDITVANRILATSNPQTCKMLGRKIQNFDEQIWDDYKVSIVSKGNILKFTQNLTLKNALILHSNKEFVEASPYDLIWGVGLSEKDRRITTKRNWKGQNLLGKILTNLARDLADI